MLLKKPVKHLFASFESQTMHTFTDWDVPVNFVIARDVYLSDCLEMSGSLHQVVSSLMPNLMKLHGTLPWPSTVSYQTSLA